MWEGEGVIKYGRKLIGATDPQKSEPGTIRGDLAVVVGRYWTSLPDNLSFLFIASFGLCLILRKFVESLKARRYRPRGKNQRFKISNYYYILLKAH